MFKVDPAFLIEKPLGLQKLYKDFVTDGDKNLNFRGSGYEL